MSRQKIFITAAFVGLSMALAACGGGDGSSQSPVATVPPTTPPTTPPPATTPESLSVSAPATPEFKELSEYVINLNVSHTGSGELSYAITSSSNIQVENSGRTLTINTADVTGSENVFTLSVTVTAGALSKTIDISAPIINSSLLDSVTRAEAMSQMASQLVGDGAQELLTVNAYLIEQAYMLGNITLTEKSSLTELVALASDDYLSQLSDGLASLQSMSEKLSGKVLTDAEAATILSAWNETLNSSVAKLASLNSLYNNYDMFGIPIPEVVSLIETDVYSLYKGNEALGSFTLDDKWEYAAAYNYLNLLVGDSKMTCPVEG
jgi:hypothetical protein